MKSLVYLSLFILCVYCQPAEKSLDKERVTKEVKQMLSQYHRAIAENGLIAEFEYLDQSNDFFWVPPGYQSALTFDSVKSILEKNALMFQSISFQWDTLNIFPLSNEIATYTGTVRGQMTDTTGAMNTVSIIESGTLIKRKDGWKLLSGQSASLSSEVP